MCISGMEALGAWPGRAEILQACAGLEGPAQQNGEHACVHLRLDRPGGHGPEKWSSCRPVQACAGMEGLAQWKETVHVCISDMEGLAGAAQ
jgi:hypothetical protein